MDALKLKIQSKKLNSGRYQVNFSTDAYSSNYYGYLLAEPKTSVTEILKRSAGILRRSIMKSDIFSAICFL